MDREQQRPRAGRRRALWLIALGLVALLLSLHAGRPRSTQPSETDSRRAAPEATAAPSLQGMERDAAAAAGGRLEAPPAEPLAPPASVAVVVPTPPAPDEGAALDPAAVDDQVRGSAPDPLRVSRTDLLGSVGAYGRSEGSSHVAPRWSGTARVERTDRAPTEAREETSEPASTAVVGRVARRDGTPVPGAEVILYSSFYLRQVFYDRRVCEIGRVYTDGEGRFDLRPIDLDTVHFGRSGEVLVTVRHPNLPDLVAQPLKGLAPGRETDVGALTLPEVGLVVTGTIRDLAGAPVAGAVVRLSGVMNPVDYDKVERMIVLADCPSAVTDARGVYRIEDVAPGRHELSVHVNLDCVRHEPVTWEGSREWSPRVRAGHGLVGRVVDADGAPVAAAVVRGGGNWTPTYPDGTFWLDNVDPGPIDVDVSHHDYARHVFSALATDLEEPTVLVLTRKLARVALQVQDAAASPVTLFELAWTCAPGRGPDEFTPRSPRWYDPQGVFTLIVPDGVVGATLTREGVGTVTLGEADLFDGRRLLLSLVPPPAPIEGSPPAR